MKTRLAVRILALCMALALLPGAALAEFGAGDPLDVWSWEELPDAPEGHSGDVNVIGEADFPGDPVGELPEDLPSTSDDPIPEFVPGIVEEDEELFYPDYELLGDLLAEDLPAYYDSRGDTQTPVKNQGSNGLCWAFAALAAMEAQLMKQGEGEQDLSELHMAYSTSNRSGNALGYDREPSGGGNRGGAATYLMRGTELSGAVDETSDPYIRTVIGERDLDLSRIKEKTWQAQNILFLTGSGEGKSSFALIKRAVQIYGGVGAGIFWQGQTTATDGSTQQAFYNAANCAYCYQFDKDASAKKPTSVTSTNHGVLIAGWDDNYPKENFNEIARPEKDGAWLIKNSWGKNWGDGGYAWVSYEDSNFPQRTYCFDGVQPYDPGEILYETDYVQTGTIGNGNFTDRWYAKLFTKETDGEEELTAVRVFLGTPYASIQVGCAPQVSGETLDGYTFASLGANGPDAETFCPGWYTIPMDTPVSVTGERGSRFAVAVRITAPDKDHGGSGIYIGRDSQTPWDGSLPVFGSGDGIRWSNGTQNYCIKAITRPVEAQVRGQVIADKAAGSLKWALIRGENVSQDSVSSKLDLPASFKGADLAWTSSDPSLIKPDGTLTLARFDKTGQVTLTAAVSRDGGTREVPFQLTVPPREPTDQDYFDAAKEWILGGYARWWALIRGENTKMGQIRSNLVIPETATIPTETGASFTIQLSPEAGARRKEGEKQVPWGVVSDTGVVTRPAYGEPDSKGLFFLRLSKGGGTYASIGESWYLTVLAYRGLIKPVPLEDMTFPAERKAVLTAEASTEGAPGQLQYQWYMSASADGSDPREAGSTARLQIDTKGVAAQAYFFCEISAPDAAPVRTDIAKVTMIPGYPAAYADSGSPGRVEACNLPLSQSAAVYAARYDADGRLTGLVRAAGSEGDTVIFGSSVGAGWKLFCLDGKSAPLCMAPVIRAAS